MSLGSLPRWQSVLLGATTFANTAYHETTIPIAVVMTTIISAMLFFRFEYADVSVISALAVLETPTQVITEPAHKTDIPENGKLENAEIYTSPREGPEDTRQFLRNLRQKFIINAAPSLGGTLLFLAAFYLLSLYGFTNVGINTVQQTVPSVGLAYTLGTISIMFTVKPDSNAVTNDRSVARRRLQSQTGGLLALYPGLDIFSVYMLLAFTIMNVARFFTVEGAQTPVSILYMLFSGLLLTNLHTAWIHAIISKPTNKTLWQRIPGWREWVGILPTASLDIILPSLAHYLTKSWMLFLRGICSAALNAWFDEKISSELETTGILIFFFAPYVSEIFVSTVMRTIYIRVAASMLPDNDEPIVPFDRSFGGRARTSERYCLGIFDAVRTMPFLNWYRYAKIIWEVLWYEEIWAVVLGIVLAMEFYYWAPCSVMELLVLVLPDDF